LEDWLELQNTLGITISDTSLLKQALVHTSYVNENPDLDTGSNERLEFLGDAVLGLIIGEKLYRDHPDADEGELTQLRSALIRGETLAEIAESIRLGDYLFMGKGEEGGGGRKKPVNLAGALEAVIAAIFLDKGLDDTRQLVLRLFGTRIKKVTRRGIAPDYESQLQEAIQAQKQVAPVYHTVEATGPDHDRVFTVEVRVENEVLGKGTGKSKKAAESEAAREALEGMVR
jgi:ribonuclease III